MSYPSVGRVVLLAALFTLSAAGTYAAPIAVVNSSFESGTFVNDGNGTDVLPVGSPAITGWTVFNDQLAWIISPNPWDLSAQDGNAFLDLTAYPTGAPFGGVQQTLTTTAGNLFQVDYYLGTYTARWGGPPVSILASAAGAGETCTVNSASTQSTWTLCTMNFVATGGTTVLSFLGTAGFQYIGLDNVSVNDLGPTTQPVPEPTSVILLGSGLALLARRRSRR